MNVKTIAKILVKRPKTVILIFTIITAIIGLQIQNVYMVSDLSGYLPQDHPSIQLWKEIDEEFQIASSIVIYVEADDIRDPYVLKEMDRVSGKVNKYDLDKGEKDSIVSVRSIAALIKDENAKPYIIGGLGGTGKFEIPEDRNLISRYIARDLIQKTEGVLFVNTYKVAIIILQLSDDADYHTVLDNVQAAIDKEARYSDMMVTGLVAMQQAIQKESMENIKIIFPIAILFISIVIFFFNRTIKGIIIIFLPLAYALALTFGVFGLIMPELTLLSIAIVALLVGLGVDYSIHLLNRFSEEQALDDKIEAVERTLKFTGKAVFLSTITTIIGFGSLTVSSMPPMVTFGLGCVIGIIFCFISATILVPCLAIILKFEKNGRAHNWSAIANIAVNNKKRFALLACFFAVMSLIVLPGVRTDVNYFEMAPKGLPEIEKYFEYSDNFGGGTNINMLLIKTDGQGLTYPEVIEAIYTMEEEMRILGATVASIADALKEVSDILERNIIIEKIAEFAGVEEIIFDRIAREGLVNDDYSKTVIIVTFPVGKSVDELESLVNEINVIAAKTVLPHNGQISKLTGQDALNVEINNILSEQQTRSMITALLLVLAMLILIFNSSLWGFLTMVPVLFVLIWEPGFLVMLDIPLSIVTISIASIMIGIGIDYGIHLTQRVREEMAEGKSKMEATRESIEKTGLSLIEAACTTIAGLSSVYFVDIPAIQQFGTVIIIMTISSVVAAVLILPMFYSLKIVK
ncbi:MAG: MMPL family transporter [Thermoplasmatales archaeon]|nr:MMPL family transporter [Thermoplasmatales archaeon]